MIIHSGFLCFDHAQNCIKIVFESIRYFALYIKGVVIHQMKTGIYIIIDVAHCDRAHICKINCPV